jgi:N-formylglutamate deformylase
MTNQDNIFQKEIQDSFVFHIPHSKTLIPDYTGFALDQMDAQMQLLTDFATEEIFSINNLDKIVFPYSRIFCDVERLPDADEPMFELGRGFFYTNSDNGAVLREDINGIKDKVYKEFYLKHHNLFEDMVQNKLDTVGFVNIVDCHSFANAPFDTDLIKDQNRPDICIGTDEFHTPKFLVDIISQKCIEHGYSFQVNNPYSGTIVPLKFYKKNNLVNSVMIEINRDLYIENSIVNYNSVRKLNDFIKNIFPT